MTNTLTSQREKLRQEPREARGLSNSDFQEAGEGMRRAWVCGFQSSAQKTLHLWAFFVVFLIVIIFFF